MELLVGLEVVSEDAGDVEDVRGRQEMVILAVGDAILGLVALSE